MQCKQLMSKRKKIVEKRDVWRSMGLKTMIEIIFRINVGWNLQVSYYRDCQSCMMSQFVSILGKSKYKKELLNLSIGISINQL